MRAPGRAGLWLACAFLAMLGAWHAAWQPLPPLQRLEWLADDLRTRALAARATAPHPDIVIVDIDEASLRAVGRWPWGRQQLAQLSQQLFAQQHVAALGMDLVFSEPDAGAADEIKALAAQDPLLASRWPAWQQALDHDRPFAAVLQGRAVVLGWYLTGDRGGVRAGPLPAAAATVPGGVATPGLAHWDGYAASLPVLAAAAPRAGFFNAQADADGVVRSVAAVARLDDALYEALSLALWRCVTGDPALQVAWRPADASGSLELAALHYREPGALSMRTLSLDEHARLRVPYRGAGGPLGGSFRYVSAVQVLRGDLPAGSLAGRIVLLGSSAPGLADLRATPIHPALPGVEVHAHVLAGLLDGALPQRPAWAPGYEVVLCLLLLLAATAMALMWPAPWALAGMGAGVVLVGSLTAWAQWQGRWVLPVAVPLLLASLQFILASGARYVRLWHQRRSLVTLFGSYLPPERVRQLVRQAEGAGITAENRELTVMFCDLQGFSRLAEQLSPLALRDLLNRYFSDTSAIVHAHGGTLDKFIGDAVMAFWGAPLPQPDHAPRAVQGALALVAGLAPLNAHLQAQGLPPVRYGVGLATGLVCVGDLGSQLRRTYTAVGDAVNLAARLEALTREWGLSLLVADSTRQACGDSLPSLLWLEVDDCQVRGRAQVVKLFTPVPVAETARAETEAQLRIWHLALTAARQHHVAQALAHLAHLQELRVLHPDTTPAVLEPLCTRLLAHCHADPARRPA